MGKPMGNIKPNQTTLIEDAVEFGRRCAALPIVPEREEQCGEPYQWEEGAPYCDTCGLFRDSIARSGHHG